MTIPVPDRFFLTRQSANIMEDLQGRLSQAGTISLLHGVRGVGKSSLLQQFIKTRLQNTEYVLIRFSQNQSFTIDSREHDEIEPAEFYSQVLQALTEHSVLIIDQFENASENLRNQLLTYWGQHSSAKNLKLIIGAQSEILQELSRTSAKLQVEIDSVELNPLNTAEQLEYLRHACCDDLHGTVKLPAELKQAFKLTNGLFLQLDSFLFQYRDKIVCREKRLDPKTPLTQVLLYGFSIILLVSVLALSYQYYFKEKRVIQSATFAENNSELTGINKPVTAAVSTVPAITAFTPPEKVPVDEVLAKASLSKQAENETADIHLKVDTKPDVAGSATSDEKLSALNPAARQEQNFLQQRLLATRAWLDTANNKSSSIQIMTIEQEDKQQTGLNAYLKKLKSEYIQLEDIKVFPITKGNKAMYGVLYGEYKNINDAYREIKRLPDVLKANQPFPRTVKGINDEVAGL